MTHFRYFDAATAVTPLNQYFATTSTRRHHPRRIKKLITRSYTGAGDALRTLCLELPNDIPSK